MPQFEPNALQRALYIEVVNGISEGRGEYLARQPEVVFEWLLQMRSTLTALAGLGRAAVRMGRSNRDTMILDFIRAMDRQPDTVLRWLGRACLEELVHPHVLRELDDEACRERFRTLATLDAGLDD